MSLSTNKARPTLHMLINEAVYCERDVLPFLNRTMTMSHLMQHDWKLLNELLLTDWYILCKFDDPTLAQWIHTIIQDILTYTGVPPDQKAMIAKKINVFFSGNEISSGIKPIHVSIEKNNVSMFQLIMQYVRDEAKNHKFIASFLINRRSGFMQENNTGNTVLQDTFHFTLVDCAILAGSTQILNLLVQNQIDL